VSIQIISFLHRRRKGFPNIYQILAAICIGKGLKGLKVVDEVILEWLNIPLSIIMDIEISSLI